MLLKQNVNMDGCCCDESIIKVHITQHRATPAGKTGIRCVQPGKKRRELSFLITFFYS